jgi:hypothetical protein
MIYHSIVRYSDDCLTTFSSKFYVVNISLRSKDFNCIFFLSAYSIFKDDINYLVAILDLRAAIA